MTDSEKSPERPNDFDEKLYFFKREWGDSALIDFYPRYLRIYEELQKMAEGDKLGNKREINYPDWTDDDFRALVDELKITMQRLEDRKVNEHEKWVLGDRAKASTRKDIGSALGGDES